MKEHDAGLGRYLPPPSSLPPLVVLFQLLLGPLLLATLPLNRLQGTGIGQKNGSAPDEYLGYSLKIAFTLRSVPDLTFQQRVECARPLRGLASEYRLCVNEDRGANAHMIIFFRTILPGHTCKIAKGHTWKLA